MLDNLNYISFQQALMDWLPTNCLILSVEQIPFDRNVHGTALRYKIIYQNSTSLEKEELNVIIKNARKIEVMALIHLSKQEYSHIPNWKLLNSETICVKDVSEDESFDINGRQPKIIEALSLLHEANVGKGELASLFGCSDTYYIRDHLLQDSWIRPWDGLKNNTIFKNLALPHLPALRMSADSLLKSVGDLWEEGISLTMIHNDFHAGHALAHADKMWLIDWDRVRYGSLFLDLVGAVPPEYAMVYYNSAKSWIDYSPRQFIDRFHNVSRLAGFRFLGSATVEACSVGATESSQVHFRRMLDIALNGR